MRDSKPAVLLILIVLFGAMASGCLGGGGGGSSTPTSTHTTSTSESSAAHSTTNPSGEHQPEYWSPWNSSVKVKIDGEDYWITYVKYRITSTISGERRSYYVEKARGYRTIHVYASDTSGNKKDLGEYRAFEYWGRITPVNDPEMRGPVEYRFWVKDFSPSTDSWFLAPMPNLMAFAQGTALGVEIEYGGEHYLMTNPGAVGKYSELPYSEGNPGLFNELGAEPLITFWVALVGSPMWSSIRNVDFSRGGEYSEGGMGISYSYKITPDGTVSLGGHTFKVADVMWSWTFGSAKGNGTARVSPELPIPIRVEGSVASLGYGSNGGISVEIELEDIEFSKEFRGINAPESSWTSTTQTSTQGSETTTTPAPSSENWKLYWDASEPLTINGERYVVREVTYNVTYKLPGYELRYTLTKGYKNSGNGYELYAIANLSGGSTYIFKVYTDDLTEYTGWVLWVPSAFQLFESGENYERKTIEGPGCSYEIDAEGNFNGDMNCGAQIRNHPLDGIWDIFNGFGGGIYGDVVEVTSLTGSGRGYSISRDGTAVLGPLTLQLYNVTWHGTWMGSQANGYTLVARELPFPVEVTASFSEFAGGAYLNVRLVDVKLESR